MAPESVASGSVAVNRLRRMLVVAALGLAGCTAAPVPATVWLRLPSLPAGTSTASTAAATAPPTAEREAWQFVLPVAMPAHLDRDHLFVPAGPAGAWVAPLAGARWIEPLRDAVPRLLREDLVRLRGGRAVWAAPLPPRLVPTRQLRVEFVALEVGTDGRALLTHVRWWLADPRGAGAPALHEARFETPVPAAAGASVGEAWALVHRQAVAEVAARIAATMRGD